MSAHVRTCVTGRLRRWGQGGWGGYINGTRTQVSLIQGFEGERRATPIREGVRKKSKYPVCECVCAHVCLCVCLQFKSALGAEKSGLESELVWLLSV